MLDLVWGCGLDIAVLFLVSLAILFWGVLCRLCLV